MASNTVYVQGSYVDVHDNEVVNLSVDKAGQVTVGEGQTVKTNGQITDAPIEPSVANNHERDEELFHFVHPEIDDEEAWWIHDAVKRLVTHQKVPEICAYLKEQKQKGNVLLPLSPSILYNELVRMGMPTGDGYTEKHFKNYYMK